MEKPGSVTGGATFPRDIEEVTASVPVGPFAPERSGEPGPKCRYCGTSPEPQSAARGTSPEPQSATLAARPRNPGAPAQGCPGSSAGIPREARFHPVLRRSRAAARRLVALDPGQGSASLHLSGNVPQAALRSERPYATFSACTSPPPARHPGRSAAESRDLSSIRGGGRSRVGARDDGESATGLRRGGNRKSRVEIGFLSEST